MSENLVSLIIAFAMIFVIIFFGVNHAKTLDSIEKGEVITIDKKIYMCTEITK